MIATLAKRFSFDAAHCLPKLKAGHKCQRLHGHTYEVELICRGPVNKETGFVIDFDDIARAWSMIHDHLDHRYLNEIEGLDTPSTENLAAWMFDALYSMRSAANGRGDGFWDRVWDVLHCIRIKESSTTWCEMGKVEWLAFCGPNA